MHSGSLISSGGIRQAFSVQCGVPVSLQEHQLQCSLHSEPLVHNGSFLLPSRVTTLDSSNSSTHSFKVQTAFPLRQLHQLQSLFHLESPMHSGSFLKCSIISGGQPIMVHIATPDAVQEHQLHWSLYREPLVHIISRSGGFGISLGFETEVSLGGGRALSTSQAFSVQRPRPSMQLHQLQSSLQRDAPSQSGSFLCSSVGTGGHPFLVQTPRPNSLHEHQLQLALHREPGVHSGSVSVGLL